jgi:hypothetical protein
MRKIAADADTLFMAFEGGAIVAGMVIAEFDALMRVIDNGLDARRAVFDMAEQRPGKI